VNKKIRFTSLLLAIVMVLSMTLLAGCGKKSEDVVVTINDEEIYLSEAMYYIYYTELELGLSYNSEYWDTVDEEGNAYSDLVKEFIMESMVNSHILYKEGQKAGIEINSDVETQLKTGAVDFYNSLSDQLKEITGLNERSIYDILVKHYIFQMQQNNIVSNIEIDTEAIKAEFNRDEYRYYTTQYLHIPFVTTDDDNNQVELSDEEKATAKATLEKALEDIKSGKDFEEVTKEYEDIKMSSANFLPGKESVVDVEYQNIAMELENEEITDVVETKNGYYIIRMENNNSDLYYNAVVYEATVQKQSELFNEELEAIKAEYTVTVNEEVWDQIKFGRTTINLDAEDTSKEESSETDESATSSETDEAEETNESEETKESEESNN